MAIRIRGAGTSSKNISRRSVCALTFGMLGALLTGCVDQHPQGASGQAAEAAKAAELAAMGANASSSATTGNAPSLAASNASIVATSVAIVEICDRLSLDLVGIPKTSSELPERYQGLETVGTPMAPDMEILASIRPDYVLSPVTLREDLQPKYEAAGLNYFFLDLTSLDGMYESIGDLGKTFSREAQATKLKSEYESYMNSLKSSIAGFESPKVLVLMGVPGSYLVATENSYVGSLVAQAGGKNIYEGSDEEFLNANIEDMLNRDPDVILRAAHALPDDIKKMFAEEFETNVIWRHFRAVQAGRVYDLTYERFGMSATFDYPEAFEELKPYLYESISQGEASS